MENKEFVWTDELVQEFIYFKQISFPILSTQQRIDEFKKSKKRKLFTYGDFEIYEGDKFWYTNSHVWKTYEQVADEKITHGLLVVNKYIPFKTEKEALDWHICNKPSLSINDLEAYEIWINNCCGYKMLINDLKKIVLKTLNP